MGDTAARANTELQVNVINRTINQPVSVTGRPSNAKRDQCKFYGRVIRISKGYDRANGRVFTEVYPLHIIIVTDSVVMSGLNQ